MTPLKLQIDLIPSTSWNSNLRKQIPRSKWNKLRKQILAEADCKCEICGSKERLNCHEKWEYDDESNVQTLIGFGVLCGICHHVHHFGRSQQLANEGYLDLDAVIEHFCSVNGVSRSVFDKHKSEAFSIWRERSKHEWQINFSEWTDLIPSTN